VVAKVAEDVLSRPPCGVIHRVYIAHPDNGRRGAPFVDDRLDARRGLERQARPPLPPAPALVRPSLLRGEIRESALRLRGTTSVRLQGAGLRLGTETKMRTAIELASRGVVVRDPSERLTQLPVVVGDPPLQVLV
jgi:hypothetical protein